MLIKKKKLNKVLSNPQIKHTREVSEAEKQALFEIQRAKQEAHEIKKEAQNILSNSQAKLKEAEKEAHEILTSANEEATNIKKKTYDETINKANKEAEVIKSEAREFLSDLFNVKHDALMQAHKAIISIALDLAEKILKYQPTIDTTILKTQVTEAIKKATSDADRIRVTVNPKDVSALEEVKESIEKLFPQGTEMVILSDESIDRGSCVVETKSGQLDARFSTQLKGLINLVSHVEIPDPVIDLTEKKEENIKEEKIEEVLSEPEVENKNENKEEKEEEIESAASIFSKYMEGKEVEPLEFKLKETTDEEIKYSPLEEFLEKSVEKNPLEDLDLPEEIVEEKEIITNEENPQTLNIEEENILNEEILSDSPLIEAEEKESEEILLEEDDDEIEELEYIEEDDEDEEEKEKIDLSKILKPKKQRNGISSIAKEVEKDPEWKDVLDDNDL